MILNKNEYFLLSQLVKREIKIRYLKSHLGNIWFILTPIMYATLYYFAFYYFLGAKYNQGENIENILALFFGVSLHAYITELIIKSTYLISANANYVKKIVFPLQLLCIKEIVSLLLPLIFSVIIFSIIYIFTNHNINGLILIILSITPFILFCSAICFLLSSLSVFIHDIKAICGMLSSVLLFLSPVLYNIDHVNSFIKNVIKLNPLTYPVQTVRDILSSDNINYIIYMQQSVIYIIYSLVLFVFSYYFFMKTKKYFADVL